MLLLVQRHHASFSSRGLAIGVSSPWTSARKSRTSWVTIRVGAPPDVEQVHAGAVRAAVVTVPIAVCVEAPAAPEHSRVAHAIEETRPVAQRQGVTSRILGRMSTASPEDLANVAVGVPVAHGDQRLEAAPPDPPAAGAAVLVQGMRIGDVRAGTGFTLDGRASGAAADAS